MNLKINPTTIVQDPGERPLVLHSQVSGPVGEMSILKRSLLMAELSMIAYNDHDEARRACQAIGFHDVTFFDRDGSQAYRVRNDHDCIVTCRGTEPHEWNDIQADANAFSVVAETVGRVHRGFRREVDDLWPMLETALAENELPTWFCGHSLGGAMATICAYRCFVSPIRCNPTGLFTFGSPRVGDRRYVRFVKVKHYRFVNNNDIVTRVPPAWMGYRHEGIEMYIDHRGRIRELSREGKRWDRIRGFLQTLKRFRLDHFEDHSIHNYITAIAAAVTQENEAQQNGAQENGAQEGASDGVVAKNRLKSSLDSHRTAVRPGQPDRAPGSSPALSQSSVSQSSMSQSSSSTRSP